MYLQNNPAITTTFEEQLASFSGCQRDILVADDDINPQIGSYCIMMELHVYIYGNGDPINLTFVPVAKGSKGRSPVDEHNALCDIFSRLCKAARNQGLRTSDPCHRFLAKNTMAWLGSFGHDAFVGDKYARMGNLVEGKEGRRFFRGTQSAQQSYLLMKKRLMVLKDL